MRATEITVRTNVAMARSTVQYVLAERRYDAEWHSETKAVAKRGSLLRSVLLNGLSAYVEVGIRLDYVAPTVTVVRIERLSTAWYAGIWSALRVGSEFGNLCDAIADLARQDGVLTKVEDG